jgi:2-polyprenyl-3-methyl-5-hydroxy-6-metoxy-1,4-benzoquinol methylase
MNGIYSLYNEISAHPGLSVEYIDKMLHKIPDRPVVNRVEYLVIATRGKIVLDLGASGPMAESLQRIAKEYHGVDCQSNPAIKNFYQVDFDRVDDLPDIPNLDIIIAGEILEHLSNAGHFLDMVHKLQKPVILTTPNAFSEAGNQQLTRGYECVNREHVCWYSYHTLKVLVERHRFKILNWYWYNGKPKTAEGLIFHVEPD